MANVNLCVRLTLGALAGLAGTMALQAVRAADKQLMPSSSPPIKKDPGEFMMKQAKRALPRSKRLLSKKLEAAGSKFLAIGYGMTFGAVYAAARPKTRQILVEGTMLGLVTWAAGYVGWLPALGLMRPVWKQKPNQIATPVAEHALYGVATVAGYRWAKEKALSLI